MYNRASGFWSPQSTSIEQVSAWEDSKDASAPDRGGAWLGSVSWHCSYRSSAGAMARPCCPRSLLVTCWELPGLGAGPGWQPHTCPAASPPSRSGKKTGGQRARKFIGWHIDGEIIYQVLLGAKQTQLRELNLFWGKSWQTLTYLFSKFPRVNSLQALLCSLVTTASASQTPQWGRGQPEASWDRWCSKYKVASLCCTFLLTLPVLWHCSYIGCSPFVVVPALAWVIPRTTLLCTTSLSKTGPGILPG